MKKEHFWGQKYSKTTADYLERSVAMNLIRKLQKDGNHRMSLFIAIRVFTGLRVSDILALRWEQILNDSEFTIIEKKTEKHRTIRLNSQIQEHIIQEHIKECYEKLGSPNLQQHTLISRLGVIHLFIFCLLYSEKIPRSLLLWQFRCEVD